MKSRTSIQDNQYKEPFMDNFEKPKDHQKRFERFLKNAKHKHGDRYDYALTEHDYTTTRNLVRITCKGCGMVFRTLPQEHVSSQPHRKGGCLQCLKTSGRLGVGIAVRWSKNIDDRKNIWHQRANDKHQKKYSYPKLDLEFLNEKSHITVVCGECTHTFRTPARVHISNQRYSGCAVCNENVMKEKIRSKNQERQLHNYKVKDEPVALGYIYKVTNKASEKFYIGYTTLDLKSRMKAHIDSSRQIGKNGFKSTSYLHNAIRKYGQEAFSIEALSTHLHVTPIALAALESEAIKQLKPHYNLTQGGDMWGPVDTRAIAVEYIDPHTAEVKVFHSLQSAAKAVAGKPHLIKRAAINGELYQGYLWCFTKNIAK
jgi:predicted GIY-YIG superfamily endonuclease